MRAGDAAIGRAGSHFKIGVGILFHEREHSFSVGAWPRPSSPAPTPAQTQESVMATDTWLDGTADWDTPSDWSAGVPDASSDVVISQGNPEVTASFGTVASIAITFNGIGFSGDLTFIDAGASSVTGGVTNYSGLFIDPNSGDGGSSLTIGGNLVNGWTTVGAGLEIGPQDGSLSVDSTVDVGSLTQFPFSWIGLYGSSTAEATLDIAYPRAWAPLARSPAGSTFPAMRSSNSPAGRSRPSPSTAA
jgi:hypothetical protein